MPVCFGIHPLMIFRLIAGERKLNCSIPRRHCGEMYASSQNFLWDMSGFSLSLCS